MCIISSQTVKKKNKQFGNVDFEAVEEKEMRGKKIVISDHKWSFKHNYLSKYCLLSKKSTDRASVHLH